MSYYIKLSTLDYPRHQGDIRLEHPEIGDEFICPDTYAQVLETPIPEYDKQSQRLYEDPPSLINNKWYKNYKIYTLTEKELDELKKAQDLFLTKDNQNYED